MTSPRINAGGPDPIGDRACPDGSPRWKPDPDAVRSIPGPRPDVGSMPLLSSILIGGRG